MLIAAVVIAAAAVVGGVLAGTTGVHRRAAMIRLCFGLVLGVLVATFLWLPLGPFLLLAVLGLAYACAWTLLEVVTNESAPPAVRATVAGLVALVGGIGIAVARPALVLVRRLPGPGGPVTAGASRGGASEQRLSPRMDG